MKMSPFFFFFFFLMILYILYLREKGLMGGAPYIGPRLGDRLIFEVSGSQFDSKERPGKLPMGSS